MDPQLPYGSGRSGVMPSASCGSMRWSATVHKWAQFIAEVEDVDKLLPGGQRAQPGGLVEAGPLGWVVPVPVDEQPAMSAEVEHVQVSAVPAGEGVVDGSGKLGEGV